MILIESEPWAAMVAHACQTYPNECCGAMLGSIDDAGRRCAWPCPSKTLSMAPRPPVMKCARKTCWAPIGPRASATWTSSASTTRTPTAAPISPETDLQNSCPWYSFVVLSIQHGEFHHAASYLPNPEQTGATQEELIY